MKNLLSFLFLFSFSQSFGQYIATDSHTAEELAAELTGDGLVVLNSVLSCGDSVNGIFSGTGELGFDNGIILSTGDVDQIFIPYEWGYAVMDNITTPYGIDTDMNNYLHQIGDSTVELYAACVLEVDVVPKASTLTMDYIYATGSVQWHGSYIGSDCEDYVDFITIFIKGGTEYSEYKNMATIPGTDIPVNANSIGYDGDGSCPVVEGGPYTEYYVGTSDDMMSYFNYDGYTTVFSPSVSVTPCDTYHLKIGVADIRNPPAGQTISSTLFLRSGSLRTTGQPVDCPDPEPSGLNDYLKQQSQIKVSPNPFVDGMALTIENAGTNDKYEITLSDLQGRKLQHYTGGLNEVNDQLAATGRDLKPGLYFLNIKSESGRDHSVKVVKQ